MVDKCVIMRADLRCYFQLNVSCLLIFEYFEKIKICLDNYSAHTQQIDIFRYNIGNEDRRHPHSLREFGVFGLTNNEYEVRRSSLIIIHHLRQCIIIIDVRTRSLLILSQNNITKDVIAEELSSVV